MPSIISSVSRGTLAAAALAVSVAGCGVNNERGDIVATKVVRPTAGGGATGGPTCLWDPATQEIYPAGGVDPGVAKAYTMALVIENRLANNANLGIGRLNTNDFQVEQARINYQYTDSNPHPALQEHVVPAAGVIRAGGTGISAVQLLPGDVITTLGASVGTTVRVKVRLEGKLLDGSGIKSSEYEYPVRLCTLGSQCGPYSIKCTAPLVAFACYSGQDSDSYCQ